MERDFRHWPFATSTNNASGAIGQFAFKRAMIHAGVDPVQYPVKARRGQAREQSAPCPEALTRVKQVFASFWCLRIHDANMDQW
ncbi:MAG: hypothetical protein Pars92KO_15120 [Parasphingorhabdus sp.]